LQVLSAIAGGVTDFNIKPFTATLRKRRIQSAWTLAL